VTPSEGLCAFIAGEQEGATTNKMSDPARGWTRVRASDGSIYFQNRAAKTTSWERPDDVPADVDIPMYHIEYKGKIETAAPAAVDNDATTAAKSPSASAPKTPWVKVLAEESGEYYYLNRKTKTTTWDRPNTGGIPIPTWGAAFKKPVPVALPEAPGVRLKLRVDLNPAGPRRPEFQSSAAMAPLWQAVEDNGDTYYRNQKSGETVWQRPATAGVATVGGQEKPQRARAFNISLAGPGETPSLADALPLLDLQGREAASQRAAFVEDGRHEDEVFIRLAALLELLQHESYAEQWSGIPELRAVELVKTVLSYLKGDHASGDVRSIVAQIIGAARAKIGVLHSGSVLAEQLESELTFERIWAHCLAGLREATVLRGGGNSPVVSRRNTGTDEEELRQPPAEQPASDDVGEFHDPSMLGYLGIIELVALDFHSYAGFLQQSPPPQLSEVLIKSLENCTDEVFPQVCMRLVDISHILALKGLEDHVVGGLTEFPQVRLCTPVLVVQL